MKIVIIVSGGNVQEVFADAPDVQVEVVDHDNLEGEELDRDQRAQVQERATAGLHCVY